MYARERSAFQKTLAMHSAPTLLGIKCANLISIEASREQVSRLAAEFLLKTRGTGLRMQVLCSCRERILLYIFHEQMLLQWLHTPEVTAFLEQYGYTAGMPMREMLLQLGQRIRCESFPHEIGVFLGYPLADVEGFIQNAGQNCLLCGYWKVYSEPEQARRTFESYGRCRDFLCDKLEQGYDLYQALQFQEEMT